MRQPARDIRLDIIRGVAMVTIGLNHVSEMIFDISGWHRLLKFPTPTYYGLSSAAEIFVMLSGYMVGMVYLAKPDAVQRVLRRAAKLYLLSIIVALLVAPFAMDASPAYRAHVGYEAIAADPWGYISRFLTLQIGPRQTDVLQLYVVLMLVAIAIVMAKRRPWLTASVSIGLYAVMQWNEAPEIWRWDGPMHPAAWQLLFVIPILAGANRAHERLFDWIDAHPKAIWTFGGMLAAAAGIKLIQIFGGPAMPWTSKRLLGGVCIVHSLILVCFYACVLSRLRSRLETPLLSWLSVIGRNSLNCFVASILATYAAVWAWERVIPSYLGYLLMCIIVLGVMLAAASILDRNKPGSMRMRGDLSGGLSGDLQPAATGLSETGQPSGAGRAPAAP